MASYGQQANTNALLMRHGRHPPSSFQPFVIDLLGDFMLSRFARSQNDISILWISSDHIWKVQGGRMIKPGSQPRSCKIPEEWSHLLHGTEYGHNFLGYSDMPFQLCSQLANSWVLPRRVAPEMWGGHECLLVDIWIKPFWDIRNLQMWNHINFFASPLI